MSSPPSALAGVGLTTLAATLLWIGILSVAAGVICVRVDPRHVARAAFAISVLSALSFFLWPVHISYWSAGGASYDASGALISTHFEEGVRPVWFPWLALSLGDKRIAIVALAPLAATALTWAVYALRLPAHHIAALVGAIGLTLTLWIGASGPSWWWLPSIIALFAVASRSELQDPHPDVKTLRFVLLVVVLWVIGSAVLGVLMGMPLSKVLSPAALLSVVLSFVPLVLVVAVLALGIRQGFRWLSGTGRRPSS
jgi:hypothetical protein